MVILDVNLLVYALREDVPQHGRARAWLSGALVQHEPLGVSQETLVAAVRIATNRRVFVEPTPSAMALSFVDAVRQAPATVEIAPTHTTWDQFVALAQNMSASGGAVPDAYLAAMVLSHDATLATADRGFSSVAGLRWFNPIA